MVTVIHLTIQFHRNLTPITRTKTEPVRKENITKEQLTVYTG